MKNKTRLLIVFTLSMISTLGLQAQTLLKQSELENFSFGFDIEKLKPWKVVYKEGKPLPEGDYKVLLDQEGRKAKDMKVNFHINARGQINGPMLVEADNPNYAISFVFKEDVVIRFERKKDGQLIESNYLADDGIFYKKKFEDGGDFKSESRYKQGELIYSKSMNLSGWDVQDEIKGTREFYRGKSNVLESRVTDKNLPKGVAVIEEKFDEKGKFSSKEIKYDDGKKKTIYSNGSYELEVPTASGTVISQYSSKGKLIKKFTGVYPMAAPITK